MKTILTTLICVTLAALGFIAVIQSRRLAIHHEELAAARGEQEQVLREAEALQAANQQLKQEQTEIREQLQVTARTPVPPPINSAAATATPARVITEAPLSAEPKKANKDETGMGNFLAKMMEDPDTRKFVRDQQRQTMDTLYAPLVKQLGLTPEQAGQFKDFLADTQMKGAEKATSLFGGGTNRAEMLATLAAEQKSSDEQIKAFLGDEGHALYKDYQLTLGERMQLNQYKTQTAGSEGVLTDQQTEMLLAVMKEEKQNVAAMTAQSPPGAAPDAANLQAMFSGDQTEKLLQTQELVNQRVFERARSVLPESQLNSFGKFQTNQLQTLRVGMTMAKKMFAPEGGAPRPNQ